MTDERLSWRRSRLGEIAAPRTVGGPGRLAQAAGGAGPRRLWVRIVLLATLTLPLFSPSTGCAAGKETTHRASDLVLTVDSTWAGCGQGGYYPLRIQVVNRGKPRDLTFRFSGRGDPVPTVTRRVSLDQNATIRFTLPVPCVGPGTYGELSVFAGGRLIKGLTETLAIPDPSGGGAPRVSLLVISPVAVDCDAFEQAVTGRLPQTALSGGHASGGYHGGHAVYGGASEDHAVIKPTLLPDNWVDYSGLDLVAVPLETLTGLDAENRDALLAWVHTGGTLLVYNVGSPANRSQPLARVLGLEGTPAAARAWQPAALAQKQGIANLEEVLEQVIAGGGSYAAPVATASSTTPAPIEFDWPDSSDAFMQHRLMLGRVVAFEGNPFPGTPHDWDWCLRSLPLNDQVWVRRNGITARSGTPDFMHFLIPSVKGIPLVAFMLLITLFTVVIGPLNYLWLWRQRRLYLLVITIPLVAMVTSLALLGYSAVAHGFGTKARVRSLTVLDQQSHTAVALTRMALFAGLSPSEGLQFSPKTAVYPIWPEDRRFESGTVDWTETQHLGGSWLPSRTRTQFLTVEHRDERGRLEVGSPTGDRLPVTNGLEWGFRSLVVCDDTGDLYYGEDIPAGASAQLEPLTPEQHARFAAMLAEYPLALPAHVDGHNNGMFFSSRAYRYGYNSMVPTSFGNSRMERELSGLRDRGPQSPGLARPRSYAAVLSERPGVNLGLAGAREQASLHVLEGTY